MNQFQTAWTGVQSSIRKMYSASVIRPQGAVDIFKPADSDGGLLRIDIGPLVFHVPEKASHPSADLFVVVSGWIRFMNSSVDNKRPDTHSFGTNIGYFRLKEGGLEHVYGAHYDMDEELPGHPVFHSQMTSQANMGATIDSLFHANYGSPLDHASGLLKNVRVPTAQMDVFAVITQIGADHLVSEKSNKEVHDAFRELRQSCDFFNGAAHRLAYLNGPSASQCYRSTHWYERSQLVSAAIPS
jgi:hypothetical protein